MPRSSSVAPRATLQTSTSVVRTSQKRLSSSRPVMFAESPKASVEPSVAALSVKKNDMDEVPDSQPPDSQASSLASSQSPRQSRRLKKDLKDDKDVVESEPVFEVPQEMQQMLQTFSNDIAKSMSAKKRKLEQVTTSSVSSGSRKFDEVWKAQQNQRQKLMEEYRKQNLLLFQQWETDLEKTRENEEKLQNQLRQQQKVFSQARIVQSQRLKSLRELYDQHVKESEELEKAQQEQQSNLMVDMKKEMAAMQKKILMDCQQQEMLNLKKSLNAMFT